MLSHAAEPAAGPEVFNQINRRAALGRLGGLLALAFGNPMALAELPSPASAPALVQDLIGIANTLWPRAGSYKNIALEAPLLHHLNDLMQGVTRPYCSPDLLWNRLMFDADTANEFSALCRLQEERLLPARQSVELLHAELCPEDRLFLPGETALKDKDSEPFFFLPVAMQGMEQEENLCVFLGRTPQQHERDRWRQVLAERDRLYAEILSHAPLQRFRSEHENHERIAAERCIRKCNEAAGRLTAEGRTAEAGSFIAAAQERAAEPISFARSFDELRSYVRTLHFLLGGLPATLRAARGSLPADSRMGAYLQRLAEGGLESIDPHERAAFKALANYCHSAAELLRFGDLPRSFRLDEERRFAGDKARMDALGIERDPVVERAAANPYRVLELASLECRISARARNSAVVLKKEPLSPWLIRWETADGVCQEQPLPDEDQRRLGAAARSDFTTLTFNFKRGTLAAEAASQLHEKS